MSESEGGEGVWRHLEANSKSIRAAWFFCCTAWVFKVTRLRTPAPSEITVYHGYGYNGYSMSVMGKYHEYSVYWVYIMREEYNGGSARGVIYLLTRYWSPHRRQTRASSLEGVNMGNNNGCQVKVTC